MINEAEEGYSKAALGALEDLLTKVDLPPQDLFNLCNPLKYHNHMNLRYFKMLTINVGRTIILAWKEDAYMAWVRTTVMVTALLILVCESAPGGDRLNEPSFV